MNKLIKVCLLADLPEGKGKRVHTGRETLAVFRHKDKMYAFQNTCPHQHGDLSEGYIRDRKLYCRLHHWAFDLDTGAYELNPAMHLRRYRIFSRDGAVYIDLGQTGDNAE